MTSEQQIIDTLKADLSMRKDNEHVGSGLGGNIPEFFFLLFHSVNAVVNNNIATDFQWVKDKTGIPELQVNIGKMSAYTLNSSILKDLRASLTSFISSDFSEFKAKYSFVANKEDLLDLNKVAELMQSSIGNDLKDLHRSLTLSHQLATSLASNTTTVPTKSELAILDTMVSEKLSLYLPLFTISNCVGLDKLVKFEFDDHHDIFSKIHDYLKL